MLNDSIFHLWNSFQNNHETFFCDSWKFKCFSFEDFLNIKLKIMFIRLQIFQYLRGKSFVIKLNWILKAKLRSCSTIGGTSNLGYWWSKANHKHCVGESDHNNGQNNINHNVNLIFKIIAINPTTKTSIFKLHNYLYCIPNYSYFFQPKFRWFTIYLKLLLLH